MRYSISDTAEYGDYVSGPRIIDERIRAEMKRILTEIQDGSFAKRWIEEGRRGAPEFKRLRAENAGPRSRRSAPSCAATWTSSVQEPPEGWAEGQREKAESVPARAWPDGPAHPRLRHDPARRRADAGRGARQSTQKVTVARQLARLRVDVIEAGFPAPRPARLRRSAVSAEVGAAEDAPAIAALARCVPADVTVAAAALDGAQAPLPTCSSRPPTSHHAQAAHDARGRALSGSAAVWHRRVAWSVPTTRSIRPRTPRARSRLPAGGVRGGGRGRRISHHRAHTVGYTDARRSPPSSSSRQAGRRHAIVSTTAATTWPSPPRHAGRYPGPAPARWRSPSTGTGERAGNASLEEVVMALRTRPAEFDRPRPASRRRLTTTAAGRLPDRRPVQRRSIHRRQRLAHSRHHQDGYLKLPLTYEIIDAGVDQALSCNLTLASSGARRWTTSCNAWASTSSPRHSTRSARRSAWPTTRSRSPIRTAGAGRSCRPSAAAHRDRTSGAQQQGQFVDEQHQPLLRGQDLPRPGRRQQVK